jgi:hypothetical protein
MERASNGWDTLLAGAQPSWTMVASPLNSPRAEKSLAIGVVAVGDHSDAAKVSVASRKTVGDWRGSSFTVRGGRLDLRVGQRKKYWLCRRASTKNSPKLYNLLGHSIESHKFKTRCRLIALREHGKLIRIAAECRMIASVMFADEQSITTNWVAILPRSAMAILVRRRDGEVQTADRALLMA